MGPWTPKNLGLELFYFLFLETELDESLQVGNALGKLVRDVNWGNLDILVVDMPPGTGDAQIAISQLVHLSGSWRIYQHNSRGFGSIALMGVSEWS